MLNNFVIAIAESERTAQEDEERRLMQGMVPGYEDDYIVGEKEEEDDDDDDDDSLFRDSQSRKSKPFSLFSSSSSSILARMKIDPDEEHLITICPTEGAVYGDSFGLFIVFSENLTRKQAFTALSAPKQV